MKIYLVDGTYELFRSHFGAPPRKAPDGREVGATLGLLRSLLMLLTTPGITHVACAFDHVIESFRNGQYPGYKTGAGVDPNLIAQFPLAELGWQGAYERLKDVCHRLGDEKFPGRVPRWRER